MNRVYLERDSEPKTVLLNRSAKSMYAPVEDYDENDDQYNGWSKYGGYYEKASDSLQ